jgi:hypothetical protein
MGVVNAEGPLTLYYIYESGEKQDILSDHDQIYESHDIFSKEAYFLETSFGKVEIGCVEVPHLTKSRHMDNYSYYAENGLELKSAPMMRYYFGEGKYSLTSNSSESDRHPVEEFAELVATGYKGTEVRPLAGFTVTPPHEEAIFASGNPPATAESLAHDEYEHLSWVTVFPPAMVDTYGRETLLSAPAWKTMELDDGAILLVTHEDPHDTDPDGLYEVADHIGLKSYSEA